VVEDLGSTNGTLVNGNPIPAPTVIGSGDRLELGGSVLRVVDEGRPEAAPGLPPREKRPALRVVSGWAPGAQIAVEEGVTLGTEGPWATAFSGDGGVAPEHTRVSPAGEGALLVEDLGSPAGTLFNGKPIPAPTLVRTGDRFQIGGSTLEVIQAAGPVRPPGADPSMAVGGVREVPEGLFARIAMRAPVTPEQVRVTASLALGWSLALVLLFREFAFDTLEVEPDLNALEMSSILPATIIPVIANSFGFYKIFRRPDHMSVRRYLTPTLVIPAIFVAINLIRINHSGAAEVAVTVVVTLLPIVLVATLTLRLRNRVARERIATVRGG
jgi:pSer/pThr/pTyr-binding forkhead associated (FHA) protein